jgi:hypothetical protein
MKWFVLLTLLGAVGILSCVSPPEPQPAEPVQEIQPQAPAPAPQPAPAPAVPQEHPSFDYVNITEEVRTLTKGEIQQLIGDLDAIIKREDYQGWIRNLDPSYLDRISSADFLAAQSQSPRLKSQESLKSAEEYFLKVVVPARANASYRLDDIDIQFIPEEEKVLAFLTTSAGRRLRLYELKNVGGAWKIVN